MLNPIVRKFGNLFKSDSAILREALKALKPEEVAVIMNALSDRERHQVLAMLDDEKLAAVLWDLSPHVRTHLIPRLSYERVSRLIRLLESDDIADLIQMLDERKRAKAVEELRKSDPKKVLPLLGFAEETAGGLMKTEIFKVPLGAKARDVRKAIAAASAQKATTVYVVDGEGALAGALSLVRLIAAQEDADVGTLMQRKPTSILSNMPQDEVVHVFAETDALELPVVDHRGKLLGAITADDLIDVMEEELTEDIARFSGTSEDEHVSDPVWVSVRRRLPWLIVNLGTAFLAAGVVALFHDTISEFVILAALVPLVGGMGGNAITQTLGVTIRAMALGEMHRWETWKIIGRQMLVGGANGFVTGAILAAVIWFMTKDIKLALVLLVSMVVLLFLAGLSGVLIPVTLKRMRIDPALASSVFATTMTDAVGFFTFLGLAAIFL